jgi:hypothetical protein
MHGERPRRQRHRRGATFIQLLYDHLAGAIDTVLDDARCVAHLPGPGRNDSASVQPASLASVSAIQTLIASFGSRP